MPAAMLVIDFQQVLAPQAQRATFVFNEGAEARDAQRVIAEACTAYHNRANDRERMLTFETASGPSTVDVSTILCVGVDDALGAGKQAIDEWTAGIGRLHGISDAAKAAATEAA